MTTFLSVCLTTIFRQSQKDFDKSSKDTDPEIKKTIELSKQEALVLRKERQQLTDDLSKMTLTEAKLDSKKELKTIASEGLPPLQVYVIYVSVQKIL